MNREIKFRCWDKNRNRFLENGEMLLGNIVAWNNNKEFSVGYTSDYELMQFTGLTDKNGKEVYEGDVVKYECGCSDGSVYKKFASVEYGHFNCSCCDGVYGWYFDGGDIRDAERYEVVGNIYENPELLTNN